MSDKDKTLRAAQPETQPAGHIDSPMGPDVSSQAARIAANFFSLWELCVATVLKASGISRSRLLTITKGRTGSEVYTARKQLANVTVALFGQVEGRRVLQTMLGVSARWVEDKIDASS